MVALAVVVGTAALAERVPHEPIVIRSDADFTPENGVVGGLGLATNPYVIAGFRIDAAGTDYGILISGTTAPFVIRDVEIQGAQVAGIKIQSAKSGTVADVWVRGCLVGVSLFQSQNIRVLGTRIDECPDAVRAFFSSDVVLSGLTIARARVGVWFGGTTASRLVDSVIMECDLGALFELGSEGNMVAGNAFFACRIPAKSEGGNRWDDGARGNFWQGFSAPDENGDGILDRPYRVGLDEDRFPLASPPGGA
ncbi:MAG: right-handed parallel beta-helix repeat-containing protein [Candidatus Acetothermia bacterium]|nr:right-handed parallel beta-helix repeat-containing protein [Candidatus Acetothermia bacterium]